MLIVYGATAGVSVVQLYAGAFFPGLMLAGLYIVYVIIARDAQAEPGACRWRPSCAASTLPALTAAGGRCAVEPRAAGARSMR